jgi:hypothetical protein
MVRLLQIAGVGALIVAGIVLASLNPWRPLGLLHLGISQDRKTEEFLKSPGAVTRFNESKDGQASDNQQQDSPLVLQAKTLENILNPRIPSPGPAQVAPVNNRVTSTSVKPPVTIAKFDVVGISYLQSDPENSFAYIRLPDNTYQWIRQGSEVGHLTVKQVKNDSIICSDGQRTSEMKVEPTVNTASMLEGGGAVSVPTMSGLLNSVPASARLSAEEEANLQELALRLKEANAAKANRGDANGASAEMDKLISEAKSSRISAEEAQKLEKLGEQLNGANGNPAEEKRREIIRRMGPPRSPKQ